MMRRSLPLLLALLAFALPLRAEALSLDEVIRLTEVGVSDRIIIRTIEDSGEAFTLTEEDLARLQNAGVSEEVIAVLQGAAEGDREASQDGERDRQGFGSSTGEREPVRTGLPRELRDAMDTHKQRRFLTASLQFFLMLERQKYPEHEVRLTYYLGDSLYQLGYLIPSQEYFKQVVEQGLGTPYYGPALTRLASIAERTGDISTLVRIIDGVDPQDFPERAMDSLYYAAGVRMFDEGNMSKALKFLREVSTSSEVYFKARYFEGVIYNEQGRLKNADNAFKQLVRGTDLSGDLQEIERVRHLALMNLARIRYAIEKPRDAVRFYALMPRTSPHWAQSVYERAYAHFTDEGMENYALGDLLTVASPFFADYEWNPEAEFLQALVFWSLCEYGEVLSVLDGFKGFYGPLRDDLREFVESYDPEIENPRNPAGAYTRLYGAESEEFRRFPAALYNALERSNNFSSQHATVLELQREVDVLNETRRDWRDSELGDALADLLDRRLSSYRKRAGRILLFELQRLTRDLSGLLASEQLLRFEVVNGQYEKYQSALQGELIQVDEAFEIDFATNPERVYWPFNDEFWQDELGFYIYTEKGACKE
jgi:hypothetical protein